MDKILDKLNEKQLQAVINTSKFTQIIAGPGTGKTTTLAAKILYTQIELEVPVSQMMGISFSRSAKSHLLNQLEDFTNQLGYGGKPSIFTFHSLAFRIIKKGIELGDSKFKNYIRPINTSEFISYYPSLVKGLCKELYDEKTKLEALCETLNRVRQGNLLESGALLNWENIDEQDLYHLPTLKHKRLLINGKDLKEFWKRVETIETKYKVTDYNGIITEAINILEKDTETKHYFTNLYKYFFVDEYQDTSLAQEKLLFSLLDIDQYVTVVGDKNQTIYTFNGSNSDNLNHFLLQVRNIHCTEPTKIILDRNYRSPQQILDLTNSLIHEDYSVYSETKGSQKPVVVETHNFQLASHFISRKIENLITEKNVKPSNICILYRKNSMHSPQADTVKEYLNQFNITYIEEKSNKNKSKSLSQNVLELQEKNQGEALINLVEFIDDKKTKQFVKECLTDGANDTTDLLEYLVELEDLEESAIHTPNESVHIRTIHSAKGLEFPYIFILYLGDKEFPHGSDPDIQEEKRLLYVGLTRAQEQLYIIGKRGLHFESFLDYCLRNKVEYIPYRTFNEEKVLNHCSNGENKAINSTANDNDELIKEIEDLQDLFSD